MADAGPRPTDCADFADELGELALGILPGRARSRVLAHVAGCARCLADLERLSAAADGLLSLAPEEEPPVGFELRVAERFGEARRLEHAARGRRKVRRRNQVLTGVAAAVVALGVGFGVGLTVHPSPPPAPRPVAARLLAARLVMGHEEVGEAIITAGVSPWVWMMLAGVSSSPSVTCEVSLAGGGKLVLGRFKLTGGHGFWGARLPATAEVRSVTLTAANGREVAWGDVWPVAKPVTAPGDRSD